MIFNITEQKINELAQQIVNNFNPEKIILFGSRAWGKSNQDSDVDFFIIKETKEPRIERERQIQRLFLGTCLPIDVIIYTPQEVENRKNLGDFFIKKILEKGKVLYSIND